MYLIEKYLSDFSAAHRIMKGYQGRCRNLHGHNYIVKVTLGCEKLNEFDFVMDFADIKTLFDTWLAENFDHTILIAEDDVSLLQFSQQDKQQHYIFPPNVNTSAESIAAHLFEVFCDLLMEHAEKENRGLKLLAVQVWENKDSTAIYQPNG